MLKAGIVLEVGFRRLKNKKSRRKSLKITQGQNLNKI